MDQGENDSQFLLEMFIVKNLVIQCVSQNRGLYFQGYYCLTYRNYSNLFCSHHLFHMVAHCLLNKFTVRIGMASVYKSLVKTC